MGCSIPYTYANWCVRQKIKHCPPLRFTLDCHAESLDLGIGGLNFGSPARPGAFGSTPATAPFSIPPHHRYRRWMGGVSRPHILLSHISMAHTTRPPMSLMQ